MEFIIKLAIVMLMFAIGEMVGNKFKKHKYTIGYFTGGLVMALLFTLEVY